MVFYLLNGPCFLARYLNLRSRSTKVDVTVVQKFNIAVPEIGLFIDFGGLFLLLFWTSKKVNKEINTVTK